MGRLIQLVMVGAVVYLAWRLLRQLLGSKPPLPPPNGGPSTNADATQEPTVRCDRCGIRVPATQLAQLRANCKQCQP